MVEVECPLGCGMMVPRMLLPKHDSNCPTRLRIKTVACSAGCGEVHLDTMKAKADHDAVCAERIVQCPKSCSASFAARATRLHAPLCPKRLEPCVFGCGKKVRFHNLRCEPYSVLEARAGEETARLSTLEKSKKAAARAGRAGAAGALEAGVCPPCADDGTEAAVDGVWYFAFAAMMNPVVLKGRSVVPMKSEAAELLDHALVFYGPHGMAAAQPAPGKSMHGVLHMVSEAVLAALDRAEFSLTRSAGRARTHTGVEVECVVYSDDPDKKRASGLVTKDEPPTARYVDVMIEGARHHGVALEFISTLEKMEVRPRKALSEAASFALPSDDRKIAPEEIDVLGDGEDGRPLYIVLNGKVLEWVGGEDDAHDPGGRQHPMYTHFKARPADKTMWAAAARYDPLYGMPTSEGDMTPDFRTYVEDTVASSPIAALFRCIGQIDVPPARDAKLEAFYFAFGSMMNPVIMDVERITPLASEPATLSDHELAFLGPGAMAVARAAVGALMHGVLHRIPREALLALDRSEVSATRTQLPVRLYNGAEVQCEVYIDRGGGALALALPSARYVDILLEGARHHGVAPSYIARLEALEKEPRKPLAKLSSAVAAMGARTIPLDEIEHLGDGVEGRPLYVVVNGKVFEWTGPEDHPAAAVLRQPPRDKTLTFAREQYDPLLGMAESILDMSDEFLAYVEDAFVTSALAPMFECIGTAEVPPPTASGADVWYFSFGSLTNPVLMRTKKLAPIASLPGALVDHELVFFGAQGMAAVVRKAGATTHGVLHRLREEQLVELNQGEVNAARTVGVARQYNGAEVECVFYREDPEKVAKSLQAGLDRPPTARYIDILVEGARHHEVESSHIEMLLQVPTRPRLPLVATGVRWHQALDPSSGSGHGAGKPAAKLEHVLPADGAELKNEKLAAALKTRCNFTPDEWKGFGVKELHEKHYVRLGPGAEGEGKVYVPGVVDELRQFGMVPGAMALTREEVASMGDGENGRPLYCVVNSKVLEWTGPEDHPMAKQLSKLPIDKTVLYAQESYDPKYGYPDSLNDMSAEFQAYVEHNLATSPFASMLHAIAPVVDVPTLYSLVDFEPQLWISLVGPQLVSAATVADPLHAPKQTATLLPAGAGAGWIVLLFASVSTGENDDERQVAACSRAAELLPLVNRAHAAAQRRGESARGGVLRVVMVLLDGRKDAFDQMLTEAPAMYAVPYESSAKRSSLAKQYFARSRMEPSMVVLDGAGRLVCPDGVRALVADPDASALPWASLQCAHSKVCTNWLVECDNPGCSKVLLRKELDQHKQYCGFRRLPCRLRCGVVDAVCKLAAHLEVCPERQAKCPRNCEIKTTVGALADGSHDTICPMVVVVCPHGCGKKLFRSAMKTHEENCANKMIKCRYGCPVRTMRKDMLAHADVCEAMTEKRFPVCDGYCRNRCRLHFDAFATPVPAAHAVRPKSATATANTNRNSWMMCQPVKVHWSGMDGAEEFKLEAKGGKWFPTAPNKDTDPEKTGTCLSVEAPEVVHYRE